MISTAATQLDAPAATQAPAVVQASAIDKNIDDRAILTGISFEIRAGAFVALLGANGAGKSTLLKILATLMRPSGGELRLFGSAVGREAAGARARIGLIAHQSMLYRDLSARENLVLFSRLHGVDDPSGRAELLLQALDLADRADDPVKAFSRGMVQRLSIARALVHKPDLLLADEPFDGLDAPSRAALESLLAQIHAAGKTIILTNHDIDQSLRLAQRVLVLRRGRLVLDQNVSSLDATMVLREMERS